MRIDILFEEGHGALSSGGLKLFILALCLTTEQALVWIATQCSSFVSLCVSVSKRKAQNCWMGDQSREFVLNGNCQMIVSALIYFLSRLLGNVTLLEQPLNSSLPEYSIDGKCSDILLINQSCDTLGFVWW